MAISAVAEGCNKQMEPSLNVIVDTVVQALVDVVSNTWNTSTFNLYQETNSLETSLVLGSNPFWGNFSFSKYIFYTV